MALYSNTYISLFAGAGGLDTAVRLSIPNARCACYVEIEAPAAALLAQAICEGRLDDAPIWSDIRTLECERFRGRVAGIIGGFPCTDLSVAGKREGIIEENRSGLWFEYARIIREVQPLWIAVENVQPVLAFPAGGIVFGELSKLGFDAVWGTVRASSVGASHIRKRAFIFAWRRDVGFSGLQGFASGRISGRTKAQANVRNTGVANTDGYLEDSSRHGGDGQDGQARRERWRGVRETGEQLANSDSERRQQVSRCPSSNEATHGGTGRESRESNRNNESSGFGTDLADAERSEWRTDANRCGYSGEGIDGQGQAASRAGEFVKAVDDSASERFSGWRSEQDRSPRDKARLQESSGRCDAMEDPIGGSSGEGRFAESREEAGRWSHSGSSGSSGALANADQPRLSVGAREGSHTEASRQTRWSATELRGVELAESEVIERREGWTQSEREQGRPDADFGGLPLFAPGPSDPRWPEILAQYPDLAPAESRFDRFVLALRRADILPDGMECTPARVGQYLRSACLSEETKSKVHDLASRSSSGIAVSRTDQLRVLGNLVCPIQGAASFIELLRRIGLDFDNA